MVLFAFTNDVVNLAAVGAATQFTKFSLDGIYSFEKKLICAPPSLARMSSIFKMHRMLRLNAF